MLTTVQADYITRFCIQDAGGRAAQLVQMAVPLSGNGIPDAAAVNILVSLIVDGPHGVGWFNHEIDASVLNHVTPSTLTHQLRKLVLVNAKPATQAIVGVAEMSVDAPSFAAMPAPVEKPLAIQELRLQIEDLMLSMHDALVERIADRVVARIEERTAASTDALSAAEPIRRAVNAKPGGPK